MNKLDEAIATFSSIVHSTGEKKHLVESLIGRGSAHALQGSLDAAIHDLSSAIDMDPRSMCL